MVQARDRLGQPECGINVTQGWSLEALVEPSRLVGANGIRCAPDGHLYVAQAFGGQLSSVDLKDGSTSIVSPADGDIVAPDDLAFDSKGNMFVTEVMSARVSCLRPNGRIDVVAGNVPVANGVTVHHDRIFMSEFRADGRILELYDDGRSPRVIADQVIAPNALSVGPDGCLYFPLVPLGEVWRVAIDGGAAEKVAEGFAIPTAVKFDPRKPDSLVVVESGSGAVTRLNIATGHKELIARLPIGIDNLAFADDGRLFISYFTDGSIIEISLDGSTRQLLEGAMLGPFGLAVDNNGNLVVADGMSFATIDRSGVVRRPAMLLEHGFPGYVRGVAVAADGSLICSNSAGVLARFTPKGEAEVIAEGFDQLMGLKLNAQGDILVCEAGAGRLLSISPVGDVTTLASNLSFPTGLCLDADGSVIVSEAGAGRVRRIANGQSEVLFSGLTEPTGVALQNGDLYVLDRGSHSLFCLEKGRSEPVVVAGQLPVGGREIRANTLPGIAGLMDGPLLPFADLVALPDGRLCFSCDVDGSLRIVSRL
jgi:sugar lactone lactonase YvrE